MHLETVFPWLTSSGPCFSTLSRWHERRTERWWCHRVFGVWSEALWTRSWDPQSNQGPPASAAGNGGSAVAETPLNKHEPVSIVFMFSKKLTSHLEPSCGCWSLWLANADIRAGHVVKGEFKHCDVPETEWTDHVLTWSGDLLHHNPFSAFLGIAGIKNTDHQDRRGYSHLTQEVLRTSCCCGSSCSLSYLVLEALLGTWRETKHFFFVLFFFISDISLNFSGFSKNISFRRNQ